MKERGRFVVIVTSMVVAIGGVIILERLRDTALTPLQSPEQPAFPERNGKAIVVDQLSPLKNAPPALLAQRHVFPQDAGRQLATTSTLDMPGRIKPGEFPASIKKYLESWDDPMAAALLDINKKIREGTPTYFGIFMENVLRVDIANQKESLDLQYAVSCAAKLCELQVLHMDDRTNFTRNYADVMEMVRRVTANHTFADSYRPLRQMQVPVRGGHFMVWYWSERRQ